MSDKDFRAALEWNRYDTRNLPRVSNQPIQMVSTNNSKRRPLSWKNNPITDILRVSGNAASDIARTTSRAASDVANTTAGIGLNTLDAATGNTLANSNIDKAELAGLMGFMMNPGKGGNVMSKLFNWYKAKPIRRGLGTVVGYEYGTGELEDLTGQNIWQMTETDRDKEARIKSERDELEKYRQEQDQKHMDEYNIMSEEEMYNMNPILDALSPNKSPLSPADSLHWARNW